MTAIAADVRSNEIIRKVEKPSSIQSEAIELALERIIQVVNDLSPEYLIEDIGKRQVIYINPNCLPDYKKNTPVQKKQLPQMVQLYISDPKLKIKLCDDKEMAHLAMDNELEEHFPSREKMEKELRLWDKTEHSFCEIVRKIGKRFFYEKKLSETIEKIRKIEDIKLETSSQLLDSVIISRQIVKIMKEFAPEQKNNDLSVTEMMIELLKFQQNVDDEQTDIHRLIDAMRVEYKTKNHLCSGLELKLYKLLKQIENDGLEGNLEDLIKILRKLTPEAEEEKTPLSKEEEVSIRQIHEEEEIVQLGYKVLNSQNDVLSKKQMALEEIAKNPNVGKHYVSLAQTIIAREALGF